MIEAYSHGMKQRLVLSASLLHEPVVIVDEPMTDPRSSNQRSLSQYCRRTRRFFYRHTLDVAQEVCDRVGILFKGRLVALGTVQDMLTQQNQGNLDSLLANHPRTNGCSARINWISANAQHPHCDTLSIDATT